MRESGTPGSIVIFDKKNKKTGTEPGEMRELWLREFNIPDRHHAGSAHKISDEYSPSRTIEAGV
jgi:hypothetical protein